MHSPGRIGSVLAKDYRITKCKFPLPLSLPPAPRKKITVEKHAAKKPSLLASHVAAKTMFTQSDKVKQLKEKIARLREQLQAQEQVAFATVAS